MRIFLAGASGVIGQRLIPRLVQAGHVVGGLTRSPSKTELLSHLAAEPILCDVFDRETLIQVVRDFNPDVILNELTDLPDDAGQISEFEALNARIRTEGNQNLIEAARQSGSPKILAQSLAWQLPDGPGARAVAELERSVLAESGICAALWTVLRARHLSRAATTQGTSGSRRPSCRTNGRGIRRANGRHRHYRLSARRNSGKASHRGHGGHRGGILGLDC
jgi:NAD dependent epimerase/dehydratase family